MPPKKFIEVFNEQKRAFEEQSKKVVKKPVPKK